MATRYTDEFRRDAVRIAITSGLTRPQVSSDLGVGLSTLNKWVQKYQHGDLMSGPHEDAEYPYWSSGIFIPFSTVAQQCICHDNELAHDGCDGQFFALACRYQLLIFGLWIGVEPCGDNRR